MSNEWAELQGGATVKWLGSSIDYTFLTLLPDYYLDGTGYASWYDDIVDTGEGFEEFSNKQKQAIYYVLEAPESGYITGTYATNVAYRVSFGDVIQYSFSEAAQDGNDVGDIAFINASLTGAGEDGKAVLPDYYAILGGEKGDVIIDQDSSANDDANIDLGESGFWLLLHELGHSFGGLLDVNNTSLDDTEFDNQKYTMMSYNTYGGVYTAGLGLLDIAALQDTYGTINTSTRAGNTVYALGKGLGFSGASANDAFLYTIWDGGGTDTIDASGFNVAAEIDLRPGRFSSIGKDAFGNPWAIDIAATGSDPDPGNVAIAYGVDIENAIGTAYADNIIGNDLDNVIKGNGGADVIDGGAGIDRVDYTGAGSDPITIAWSSATQATDGRGGTLLNIESFTLGGGSDTVIISPDVDATYHGRGGSNTVDYSALPDESEITLTEYQAGFVTDSLGNTLWNFSTIKALGTNSYEI